MATEIRDKFLEEVLTASAQPRDHRFKEWAKFVDAVDPAKVGGYAFRGAFVKSGTVEIEVGVPHVILASTAGGSRRYNTRYYCVLVLEKDGTLRQTGISTDNGTPGWALRIRTQVAELLKHLQEPAPPSAPVLTAEEALAFLNVLAATTKADIKVTDWTLTPEANLVEVEIQQDGTRGWMSPDEAATFIASQIGGSND